MGTQYASGNWHAKAGKEDEFIKRWKAFTKWSLDNAAGARDFMLLRDESNASHFISLGEWDDADSRAKWRSTEEFPKLLGACREVCHEFVGGDYAFAASPTRS
jgi:heme-degrading monooxygenase HmoA